MANENITLGQAKEVLRQNLADEVSEIDVDHVKG